MLKFLPLLQLAPKLVGLLGQDDLVQLASAFVPKQSVPGIVSALAETRSMSGEDAMAHILGSPAAKELMTSMNKQTEEADAAIFVRCPDCGFTFEAALSPSK